MAWVEVNGHDIHYEERGSGTPIVFLHGFGSCAEAWFQQFTAFSDRYRVIAYDSINHGHSSNSERDAPEPDRADELEGFLAALGIDRPVLAGNSMGGLTVLRWAMRHPDQAAALVPSGVGIPPPGGESDAVRANRRALRQPLGADVLFLPAAGGFTDGFVEREPLLYNRYVRLRSTATRIEASRHPRRATLVRPGIDEAAELVPAITSPMQIIVGEHDWLRSYGEQLHATVNGSRFAMIPGAPHNVYYESAAAYNNVVSAFLAEVLAPVS